MLYLRLLLARYQLVTMCEASGKGLVKWDMVKTARNLKGKGAQ